MAARRVYEKESDRLTALEVRLDALETSVAKVSDQIKWQTRALIGAMLTLIGSLGVVLLVLPHG